jgi:hypothetical protein
MAMRSIPTVAQSERSASPTAVADVQDRVLTDLVPISNRNFLTTFLDGLRQQREVLITGGREMAASA